MFERPQSGVRAILVHVSQYGPADPEAVQEFNELTASAGAESLALIVLQRRVPDQRYFIGSGKALEISGQIQSLQADLVIFDHELSPSQERNLEKIFACRVLDRTGLILDIFAQRARSHEGKLQVELAQLAHLSTRLIRGWTHLERQKGGIGLRGPGETQLETDRRLLGQRISQIRRRLQKVDSQREQSRRARKRTETPTVSVVGYTNAGKSTLFNQLTQAEVYAQDQLFATLDPTLRRLTLPSGSRIVLADTVGFISRLPHALVAAFKSTLQETIEADLLIQVIDAASPRRAENTAEVQQVLAEINADATPQLAVYNKIDLLEDWQPRIDRDADNRPVAVWLSAATGEGTDLLQIALQELLITERVSGIIKLNPAQGRLRALLFEHAQILHETNTEQGGWELHIEMSQPTYARLSKQNEMPVF